MIFFDPSVWQISFSSSVMGIKARKFTGSPFSERRESNFGWLEGNGYSEGWERLRSMHAEKFK